jgi:hypothetical protein
VYEAEQQSIGRRVALKLLPFAGLADRTRLDLRQAKVCRLNS